MNDTVEQTDRSPASTAADPNELARRARQGGARGLPPPRRALEADPPPWGTDGGVAGRPQAAAAGPVPAAARDEHRRRGAGDVGTARTLLLAPAGGRELMAPASSLTSPRVRFRAPL